jgi:hypothetical protein
MAVAVGTAASCLATTNRLAMTRKSRSHFSREISGSAGSIVQGYRQFVFVRDGLSLPVGIEVIAECSNASPQ